jgi:hypothetical protein
VTKIKLKHWHSISAALLIFGLLTFQNCGMEAEFTVDNGSSGSGPVDGLQTEGANDSDTGITSDPHPTTGNGGRPPNSVQYCDDQDFAGQQIVGECLALFDTFDRDVVAGKGQFNWMQFIDDTGRSDALNVQANIFTTGEHGFGQALHEEHAVYVTGRRGGSVHEVYLISQPLDLTLFDHMEIEFNYLPIDLKTWSWRRARGLEHIRMDLCSGSIEDCVGPENGSDKQIKKALNGQAWTALYLQPGFVNDSMDAVQTGQANDGRNHIQGSWLLANSQVNLNDTSLIADKSQVVFRISVMLDEGFKGVLSDGSPDFSSDLDDGMGLDYVKVFARQSQNQTGAASTKPPK